MRTLLTAGLLGLSVLVGCVGVVDSTGTDPDPTNPDPTNPDPTNPNPDPTPTPTPKLAATIDKAAIPTALGETITLTVDLTGSGDFAGAVTLTPSIVDAGGLAITGWTFTMTPATVTLAKNGTQAVVITAMVPTDSASLAPNINVAIAAAGVTTPDVTSALTITNTYTIHIKAGTGTANHSATFPSLTNLKLGAKLVFHNADTIIHRIHADGGFAHEPNDLQPGASYTVTPSGGATFYCHDHDDGVKRNIAVQ